MARQPKLLPLSPEEAGQMIEFEVAQQATKIAEAVFKNLYKEESAKMDGKVSQIIYGGIIATALVLLSIFAATWLFMSSYQQNFLEAQSVNNQQVNDLRRENIDLQSSIKNDMEQINDKQEFLEKILLER